MTHADASSRDGRLRRGVALIVMTVIAATCVAPAPIVRADTWPHATVREVFSASREWFVRVVPGQSVGDTVGFAGSPKGAFATAEWYRRQPDRAYRLVQEKTLANPVAPVDMFVTDHGYLVTLDNWHNYGYGKVVALYDPTGASIRAFELRDLFSADEIERAPHSASSIRWRTETAYIRDGQRSLYVSLDGKGRELILEIDTGAWQVCEPRGGQHRCRTTNTNRTWAGYVEPKGPSGKVTAPLLS